MEVSGILPPQLRDFSADVEAKITEFMNSRLIQPYLLPRHSKFFIHRFLRARKYDLDAAIQMFIEAMKWREEMKVDSIFETFPKTPQYELLVTHYPASYHWKDPPLTKDSSVVLLSGIGRVDPSIIQTVGYQNLVQFHIWCMETLERLHTKTIQEKGYWPGFVMIEDLEGVGYHTFSTRVLGLMQEITRINQNYYPDMLRKMYIINVPSIFYIFWKVIQLWLEQRSIAKIELINGKASIIADKIEAIFDLSSLPLRLGGTSTRDIPLAGFGAASTKMREKPRFKIDIPRGTKHEVSHYFEIGDIISWEFILRDYDIGFTLLYTDENKEIQKIARCEAKKLFSDSITIENPGTYLFLWDNTYSWTRGKFIKYNIYKGLDILD